MDDKLFNELLEIVSKKAKKINIDDNPLLKYILKEPDEEDIKNTKLSDVALYHSCIEKGKYTFNIFTIPKKIPVRNQNSSFKLDFDMKQFYVVDIAINNDDSYCSLTLNRCDNRKESKKIYLEWKDFILNNELETIFTRIISGVKK